MKITLQVGESLEVCIEGAALSDDDPAFTITYGDQALSVEAHMPDTDGKIGVIYSERYEEAYQKDQGAEIISIGSVLFDPTTRLPEDQLNPTTPEQIAAFFEGILGVRVQDLRLTDIEMPVMETSGDRLYVKFMSNEGKYDNLLGDRFANACLQIGVTFERERQRSGFVNVGELPALYEWVKAVSVGAKAAESPCVHEFHENPERDGQDVCISCGQEDG